MHNTVRFIIYCITIYIYFITSNIFFFSFSSAAWKKISPLFPRFPLCVRKENPIPIIFPSRCHENPRILNTFIMARTMESSSNSCGEQDDVLSCEVVCLIYLPLSNTRRSTQSCMWTYQVFILKRYERFILYIMHWSYYYYY